MADFMENFLINRVARLRQINPNGSAGPNNGNCPLVASATRRYFLHHGIQPVPNISHLTLINTNEPAPPHYRMYGPALAQQALHYISSLTPTHGRNVVVHGRRPDAFAIAHDITRDHYFNVVNTHGQICVVDGYGDPPLNPCTLGLVAYMNLQGFNEYTVPADFRAWVGALNADLGL